MSYPGAQGGEQGSHRREASPGAVLGTLLVSAAMAVLLLLIPSPLSSLGMPWRWPLIVLGVWGVGAGLMGPLAMDMSSVRLRGFSHGWPSRLALAVFALCWCLLWLAGQR
jgi:hypothetical protein